MTLLFHRIFVAAGLSRCSALVAPNPSHHIKLSSCLALVAAAVCGGRLWSAPTELPQLSQNEARILLGFGVSIW